MRDLLLIIIAMLTLLVLIGSANQPQRQGQRYWQVSLQTLLSAIILASILFGIVVISNR
jgi:hypothetical protein